MFKLKYKLFVTAVIGFSILFMPGLVSAQSAPAGCPGGPAGPPMPGTVCLDGSIPMRDSTLPAGCQGSSLQGPPSEGTVCPARPGREACTFTQGVCVSESSDPSRGATLNADCDTSGNCCESDNLTKDNCTIIGYIVTFTNILSALVGIVIVIMIAVGGIQYTTARDDPQAVSAAKHRIQNAVLALVFYLFGFAFLQYLIPGGIF